ncbi:MAG: xanthine dehydrogenase family protein molybdopterin-binding subunit, partial [Alphaproteobacteria bacterium]
MGATTMIGERVKRLEDPRLLKGEASFVDDIQIPETLHAAILRSPHANARIRGIDLSSARAAAGVVDAFSLADAWDEPPTIPVLVSEPSLLPCPQYPMARDQVRYVGEPVAVIVAENRALAEDALELAVVDYEPLPAVAAMQSAAAPGATILHDTVPDNMAARWTQGVGDVAAAFNGADHVVHEQFSMQRYTGVPMETRGVLATHDAVSGELTIWASGQWPHTARSLTAALLGLDEQNVRMILPEVGGGFGVKVELYPEDILIPFAANRLGRPVKWIEDRQEHMLGIVHAREMDFDLELALKSDGTILGLRGQVVSDQGAYFRTLGIVNPSLAITSLPGPYRIENYSAEMLCVLTNKSPSSPYRGAGGPEAAYARERLFDVAARELDMDPAEFRMKNLLPPEALPYDTGLASVEASVIFDSGDFPAALRQALDTYDYAAFRKSQAQDRANGKLRGLGICVYTQLAAVGPYESAEVRVTGGGKVTVVSGAAPQGQGTGTTLAQIVAETLEVPLENISVSFADTARIPFGVGTYASRNAVMAGSATLVAT